MSVETNKWTELTREQTAFFTGQLAAVSEIAFSQSAQEANIVPLNATRYSFSFGNEQPMGAIMWPDPYETNTACIVTTSGNTPTKNRSSFLRVKEAPESYDIEGVAVGLSYARGASLYGRQLHLRHDMDDTLHVPHIGMMFLASAQAKSDELTKISAPQAPIHPVVGKIVGVDSTASARMFRSLNSLHSNLVVAGTTNENGIFSDQTYDLANTLMKMSVSDFANNPDTNNGMILMGTTGRPIGAVTESERHGIVVVRRIDTFPDTIALATVKRPKIDDDTIFIDQHNIQARGVTYDMMTLPAEAYNAQSILGALAMLSSKSGETASAIKADLDQSGKQVLEQKIISLMVERANQTY